MELVPAILQSFTLSPSRAHTSLRQTVGAGPECVPLRGSWLHYIKKTWQYQTGFYLRLTVTRQATKLMQSGSSSGTERVKEKHQSERTWPTCWCPIGSSAICVASGGNSQRTMVTPHLSWFHRGLAEICQSHQRRSMYSIVVFIFSSPFTAMFLCSNI